AVGIDLVADSGGLAAQRADQGHVGDGDGHVLVDDAALHRGLGGPLVLLGHVDAVDDDLAGGGEHTGHLALGATVLAREHLHAVALLDLEASHGHSTSGASDTIFMNFLSRSSRPT